jgi:hypothetical protein
MADPVSWLMIEPGWRVESADGAEVGRVEEVTGDSNADIFDGLAIAFTELGHQHYVPSEQVAEITEGSVRLKLDRQALQRLPEFLEPPEQEQIESERAPRGTRAWSRLTVPSHARANRTPWVRRLLEWRGRAGKR